jgi:hypothetical protein
MTRIVALAALALTACTSTQGVLDKPATEIYQANRPVEEVIFCIADKNHTPPLKRSDGSTVLLIKNGYGAVSLAFTVWPDGRIEYRREFGTIGNIWKQCI